MFGSSSMSIFIFVFILVIDGGYVIVCCVVEVNCKIVLEECGFEDICFVMGRYNIDVGLVEVVCFVLWLFFMEGNVFSCFVFVCLFILNYIDFWFIFKI